MKSLCCTGKFSDIFHGGLTEAISHFEMIFTQFTIPIMEEGRDGEGFGERATEANNFGVEAIVATVTGGDDIGSDTISILGDGLIELFVECTEPVEVFVGRWGVGPLNWVISRPAGVFGAIVEAPFEG